MGMLQSVHDALNHWSVVFTWVAVSAVSVGLLVRDVRRQPIMPMMKWVWGLTVAYSGPLGLLLYYSSGREQIDHDSLWRRGVRSVAHCYSGCGAGEIVGILVAAVVLAAGQLGVSLVTFAFAYCFGLALTVVPLMQDGEALPSAFKDAVISESASIVVMEAVAIAVDQLLAGSATFREPIFWASMLTSLTIGLMAAYPVNVLLIHYGVKEGMADPSQAKA